MVGNWNFLLYYTKHTVETIFKSRLEACVIIIQNIEMPLQPAAHSSYELVNHGEKL